jgi:hypothetical protein
VVLRWSVQQAQNRKADLSFALFLSFRLFGEFGYKSLDCCAYLAHAPYCVKEKRKNMRPEDQQKQNITISLSRHVLRKAKILAAKRETSISGLLAQEIEMLVGNEEAYERAERQAIALLERGFHMGGVRVANRDELHER